MAATEIIPYLFYRDAPAALDWLARAFGFREDVRHLTPNGMHAQMSLDGCRIMLGQGGNDPRLAPPSVTGRASAGVFVYVADVADHHARAQAAGAEIEAPPADHGYGPTYTARDLDGHPWFFTQSPA